MSSDKTPSKTSPKGGNRGCLCSDGKTYSKKCCNGDLQAQGIGSLYNNTQSNKDQIIIERVITNS